MVLPDPQLIFQLVVDRLDHLAHSIEQARECRITVRALVTAQWGHERYLPFFLQRPRQRRTAVSLVTEDHPIPFLSQQIGSHDNALRLAEARLKFRITPVSVTGRCSLYPKIVCFLVVIRP
jgi:hypothetical protein